MYKLHDKYACESYIVQNYTGFMFCSFPAATLGRRQTKTLILSTNVDQTSLETEFLIAICRPTGDKWQSKTLFLAFVDPHSSIVKCVFDCRLSGVLNYSHWFATQENLSSGFPTK